MPANLSPDLVEMLSAFANAGARYLVIGGHAVSLHARPRTTKDLDLWLDAEPENIARVCSALTSFGVPPEIVDHLRVARPDEIVWMGRVPSRIDLLQTVPGLDFGTSWERRVIVDVAGVLVPFLGRDDLLANKPPRPERTIREMTFEQATEEDACRYLAMTPAERVRLVPELFAACLSTRGIREPPRLRRVYSYPEQAPGPLPGHRRLRRSVPRAPAGDG